MAWEKSKREQILLICSPAFPVPPHDTNRQAGHCSPPSQKESTGQGKELWLEKLRNPEPGLTRQRCVFS